MSSENRTVKQLPLSHTIYLDNEINPDKAKNLVVYRYSLGNIYKWKEWTEHLDKELSMRYYPYFMKKNGQDSVLFVSVDSEKDKPPIILNKDNVEIIPEKVEYSQEFNPVWIRLIMRKVSAFGTHCKGSHTLGRPLLKIDTWNSDKISGINAISLDCRTQQRKDGNTTEVVLFHEHVTLCLLETNKANSSYKKSMWVYDKNNILVRWIPNKGECHAAPVYTEILKNKNKRRQQSFIDLSNSKTFAQSWPVLLKPIQKDLIIQAAKYGFYLKPVVLNLEPLPLKTKYKANPKTRSTVPSVTLLDKILVLDLRYSKKISSNDILTSLKKALTEKSIKTKLELLDTGKKEDLNKEDLNHLSLEKKDSVLILLDQYPKVEHDKYPLTEDLRTRVACQHINVNPNDLQGHSFDKNLINENIEDSTNEVFLKTKKGYYDYELSMFDNDSAFDALKRNLEISIKELSIKHLLINEKVSLSSILPKEQDLLTEDLIVITDGYLFTVKNKRPILLFFKPDEKEQVIKLDKVLTAFNTSTRQLWELLYEEWPYNYKLKNFKHSCGKKLEQFARRLTIVIHKEEKVSIYIQDPKYDTPHILPNYLEETLETLKIQSTPLKLQEWMLPKKETLEDLINQLINDGELPTKNGIDLLALLNDIHSVWEEAIKQMWSENITTIEFKVLKQKAFKLLLILNNKLVKGKDPKSRISPFINSSWVTVLSRYFKLPLQDIRSWLRDIPGIQKLWHDPKQGYYVVGSLTSPQLKIERQPSIRQWHTLQGDMNTELLTSLLDVDWVRSNQLAGNPCVALLVRRWRDCQILNDENSQKNLGWEFVSSD